MRNRVQLEYYMTAWVHVQQTQIYMTHINMQVISPINEKLDGGYDSVGYYDSTNNRWQPQRWKSAF